MEDLRYDFSNLSKAELVVDAVYQGRGSGSVADDPIARLLPVGNLGGFRCAGSVRRGTARLAVLYTTSEEPDWPDTLDPETGTFVYYGDNRRPGHELHGTTRGGSLLLRDVFDATHSTADERAAVPPFLLFEKVPDSGRDVRFRGLLCAARCHRPRRGRPAGPLADESVASLSELPCDLHGARGSYGDEGLAR